MIYYSTKEAFDEVLESLDGEKFERSLVRDIEYVREEIYRQMAVTLELTKKFKAGRSSAIELEAGRCTYRHMWMNWLSSVKILIVYCVGRSCGLLDTVFRATSEDTGRARGKTASGRRRGGAITTAKTRRLPQLY